MIASNPIRLLRHIAFLEGISFLLLLGVAMPLKYLADLPVAVKIAGWFHGALFVAVCLILMQVMNRTSWSFLRCAAVFVSALLPFGPFIMDSRLKAWEKESV